MTHALAKEIKALYETELMEWDSVTGVGLGTDSLGRPVLKIYLSSNRGLDFFPREIDGLPVVYEIVGAVVAG